jgi:hypothetical protein
LLSATFNRWNYPRPSQIAHEGAFHFAAIF